MHRYVDSVREYFQNLIFIFNDSALFNLQHHQSRTRTRFFSRLLLLQKRRERIYTYSTLYHSILYLLFIFVVVYIYLLNTERKKSRFLQKGQGWDKIIQYIDIFHSMYSRKKTLKKNRKNIFVLFVIYMYKSIIINF